MELKETYKVMINGSVVPSELPGQYAGWTSGKIFGRLDCESGKRLIDKRNRVFFLTMEDAIFSGYRPCGKCNPMNQQDFQRLSYMIKEETLTDFYNRDNK